MRDILESERAASRGEADAEEPAAIVRRIFRGMFVTVALAVALSAFLFPWRVTTGLLLGGLLSLLNFHWLRASIASVFGGSETGAKPKLGAARYVLRYVVVASAVALFYALDAVSIVATLAGLCSFVAPALFEGFMQLYFAVIRREEL